MKGRVIPIILAIVALIATIYLIVKYYSNQLALSLKQAIDTKKKASDSSEVIKTVIVNNPGLNLDLVVGLGSTASSEIKSIQRILGVTSDGVFGPQTLAALKTQYGIDRTSINGLLTAVKAKDKTIINGGKDLNGLTINAGDEAWTQSSQIIYTLIPKKPFVSGQKIGYDDFKIGEEYRTGANFDVGTIFDFTPTAILTVKQPSVTGRGAYTQYYYATNNQIAVVKKK